MIPRAELQAKTSEWGLTEEVVEKDYVLGWLLWGIGSDDRLRDRWIFKGGTCLKKCYIETYRFSEDLDFTVRDGGPLEPDDLLPVLEGLLDRVEQASGIRLTGRRPLVRMRPNGRSAEGRIYYVGPRGAPQEARVKLDLTYDEVLVEEPEWRSVVHPYDDRLPDEATVLSYPFVEVFAEKIRALGQRTRPRDLYDVVNLYRRSGLGWSADAVRAILRAKSEFKGIEVPTLAAVAGSQGEVELRADWEHMLAHQLPALPSVDEFLGVLPEVFAWLEGEEFADELSAIPELGQSLDSNWMAPPTLTRWPAGVPLEQVRFAGANRLLVELTYQGTTRLIEPYSLRRSKAGDLLLYGIKAATGEIRSYRVDQIQGVRPTDESFIPRFAIELASVRPVRTGRRRRGWQP